MLNLDLHPGAHVCHLYTNLADQKQVVLPFCRDGLQRNEHCLLTAAQDSADEWFLELQAFGIDVQEMRDSGSLVIKAVRPPPPQFNAVKQTRDLWRMVEPLLARFDAVRLLREVTWSPELALQIQDLCHFEAAKDLLFADTPVRSICQYDLAQHPPAAIHTALRTHPLLILDGSLHENPFYEAHAILAMEPLAFASDADATTVERLLARFR
jgi:chemotaxis family two-component system sensor kinase Cph1